MLNQTTFPTPASAMLEVFRLQQRMVVRGATYLRRLGDLASQGSIEPREYIEEWFDLCAGMLEEYGDCLQPQPGRDLATHFYPLSRQPCSARAERCDCPFSVPSGVWDRWGEDAVIRLFTDGLVRAVDPSQPLRPTVTLAPRHHVDVFPPEIRRHERKDPELKLFGLSGLVAPQERYHGLVWGAVTPEPQKGAASSSPATRFPVAAIEIEFV